jgi:hypothetical protein
MVHAVSGEVRWRRPATVTPSEPTAVAWLPGGVVVGEEGGRTATYDPANGRRIERTGARWDVAGERELEWAHPYERGVVLVHAGLEGTRVVATDALGNTAWERLLGRMPTVGSGPARPSDHLVWWTGSDGDVPAGLWVVARGEEAPMLVRIDLPEGTVTRVAAVGATSTAYAVDHGRRRCFYVDTMRNLVGAAW